MMAAMMLPAAAPMILTFAAAQARRDHAAAVPTWIFIAGYLFVWSAVGVVVYGLVQVGADAPSYLGSVDRAIWGPLVLGVTLVGAGVYQFTPLKRVCLRHCRSPMAFVALHWSDGPLGAVRMGIWHGAYCLGNDTQIIANLEASRTSDQTILSEAPNFQPQTKVLSDTTPSGDRRIWASLSGNVGIRYTAVIENNSSGNYFLHPVVSTYGPSSRARSFLFCCPAASVHPTSSCGSRSVSSAAPAMGSVGSWRCWTGYTETSITLLA